MTLPETDPRDPDDAFDAHQDREGYTSALSRRSLLRFGAAGAAVAAAVPAHGSISALMCPPRRGSFAAGAAGAENTAPPGSGMTGVPQDYSGEVPDDGPGLRRLHMTNWATGETFNRPFVEGGEFNQDALDEFSRFARDRRQNEWIPFDPNTIQIIWEVSRRLNMSSPFNLNSGYRSPVTNASLPGAAQKSLHLRAKAADISTSARSVAQVYNAAWGMQRGGVGKYTGSNFVHVDTGRVRTWGS